MQVYTGRAGSGRTVMASGSSRSNGTGLKRLCKGAAASNGGIEQQHSMAHIRHCGLQCSMKIACM